MNFFLEWKVLQKQIFCPKKRKQRKEAQFRYTKVLAKEGSRSDFES